MSTYLSCKKGKPKNFAPNTSLYFGKVFEIPKDFSRTYLFFGERCAKELHSNTPLYFGKVFEIP